MQDLCAQCRHMGAAQQGRSDASRAQGAEVRLCTMSDAGLPRPETIPP